jgi:hypothetical protein
MLLYGKADAPTPFRMPLRRVDTDTIRPNGGNKAIVSTAGGVLFPGGGGRAARSCTRYGEMCCPTILTAIPLA